MRPPASTHYLALAALVLVLLLGTWLRFYRIDYQSYWNDEGNSLRLAGRGAQAIVLAAAADVHPPGYYLLLKGWRALLGETEFALRGLSAFAGVVLIALLYRLGRLYFDQPAAVATAFLGAAHPFLVYYAQEARMYSLAATLGAASFLLFSLWLRSSRPEPGGNWKLSLAYCLVTAFGLYTHYAFALVVAAQNMVALGGLMAHRRGASARRPGAWMGPQAITHTETTHRVVSTRLGAWVGLQAVTLGLFLPWLPIAARQLATWPAAREFQPFGAALAGAARYLVFGRTIPTDQAAPALVAAGLLLVLGLRRGGPRAITPFIWLAVPVGLTLGFGLFSEPFSKFLLVAAPPVCLLLGNGLVAAARPSRAPGPPAAEVPSRASLPGRITRDLPLVGIAILAAALAYPTYLSLNNLYFNPAYYRDDYRSIARYLDAIERPGDAVITISPNQVEAFSYYHHPDAGDAPVYPLPRTRPPDPAETASALAGIAAAHDRLFVLYWGEDQADPEHVVETWLNTNTFKAGDAWYGQVRLATYAAAQPAQEIATRSGARFGDEIVLEGYTLSASTLVPGDILQITLFWRTDAALEGRYKVFVHIYAALDQPPIAQQDGEPGGGLLPTTTWAPGEQLQDNHGVLIPPDLPAGRYQLAIGLYPLFGDGRLPVVGGGAVGDRLVLGTIRVDQ